MLSIFHYLNSFTKPSSSEAFNEKKSTEHRLFWYSYGINCTPRIKTLNIVRNFYFLASIILGSSPFTGQRPNLSKILQCQGAERSNNHNQHYSRFFYTTTVYNISKRPYRWSMVQKNLNPPLTRKQRNSFPWKYMSESTEGFGICNMFIMNTKD